MVTIYSCSEQEIFVVLDLFYLVTGDGWDYWQSNLRVDLCDTQHCLRREKYKSKGVKFFQVVFEVVNLSFCLKLFKVEWERIALFKICLSLSLSLCHNQIVHTLPLIWTSFIILSKKQKKWEIVIQSSPSLSIYCEIFVCVDIDWCHCFWNRESKLVDGEKRHQ